MFPDKAFNTWAINQTRYTPDIALLELSEFRLLFVCDDMMRSGKNYKLIQDHSAKVAKAFTMKAFRYYRKRTDGTGIPMAVAEQPDNRFSFTALKIKGEIHAVRSSHFPRIDTHYENGRVFRRIRTKVLYPYTPHGMIMNKDIDGRELPKALQGPKHFLLPERVEPIPVFMYVGVPSYWGPLLDGGFEFETVPIAYPKEDKNWLIKYYHYQNRPG